MDKSFKYNLKNKNCIELDHILMHNHKHLTRTLKNWTKFQCVTHKHSTGTLQNSEEPCFNGHLIKIQLEPSRIGPYFSE